MGTGNAGKVIGSLWRKCSEPHTTENESGPIRFEKEDGHPDLCSQVESLPFYLYTQFFEFGQLAIPNFAKKGPKRQAHIRIPCQCEDPPGIYRIITSPSPISYLYTPLTLRACCSQSKFRILNTRK